MPTSPSTASRYASAFVCVPVEYSGLSVSGCCQAKTTVPPGLGAVDDGGGGTVTVHPMSNSASATNGARIDRVCVSDPIVVAKRCDVSRSGSPPAFTRSKAQCVTCRADQDQRTCHTDDAVVCEPAREGD